jgi:hypothetical protein
VGKDGTKYAIAVRDAEGLWLFRWLKRGHQGDVYLLPPTATKLSRDWRRRNPHASYHKDGRSHIKSFAKSVHTQRRQKPDATFSGTEQLLSLVIDLVSVRSLGVECRPDDYAGGVFEIPADEISQTLEECRTAVAVDLVAPSASPLIYPLSAAIRRKIFDDAMPHISVTLWDQHKMFSNQQRA